MSFNCKHEEKLAYLIVQGNNDFERAQETDKRDTGNTTHTLAVSPIFEKKKTDPATDEIVAVVEETGRSKRMPLWRGS
jgi:hypothetical protein